MLCYQTVMGLFIINDLGTQWSETCPSTTLSQTKTIFSPRFLDEDCFSVTYFVYLTI